MFFENDEPTVSGGLNHMQKNYLQFLLTLLFTESPSKYTSLISQAPELKQFTSQITTSDSPNLASKIFL